MKITLNGKAHEIPDCEKIVVSEFVESLELGGQPVLVELNHNALLSRELTQHCLKNGDEVEIIRMVAGG